MADKTVIPGAKQRLSSPERRAAIIDAALHLFAEKGFRGTTTREIAAKVGVSEPILYEHFRTKRDLYTAIIDARSQSGADELAAFLDEYANRQDDVGFFSGLAKGVIQWYERDPDFVRILFFAGLEGHELKDLFYERHNVKFFRQIALYIEVRIAAGALRPVDPVLAARAFFGMVAHYCISSMIFACAKLDVSKDDLVATIVDVFLHGVAATEKN